MTTLIASAALALVAAVLVTLAAVAWCVALRRLAHARGMTQDIIRVSARAGRRWALWLDREERRLDKAEEMYG